MGSESVLEPESATESSESTFVRQQIDPANLNILVLPRLTINGAVRFLNYKAVGRDKKSSSEFYLTTDDLITCMPLTQALSTDFRQWDSPAHLLFYAPANPTPSAAGTELYFRLNKPCVKSAEEVYGRPIDVRILGVDWDLKVDGQKATWDESPDMWELFEQSMAAHYQEQKIPVPTFAHRTKSGYHWCYVLADGASVDEAGPMLGGLVDIFRAAGWMVDDLHDWTRAFKLPYVKGIPDGFDAKLVWTGYGYSNASMPRRDEAVPITRLISDSAKAKVEAAGISTEIQLSEAQHAALAQLRASFHVVPDAHMAAREVEMDGEWRRRVKTKLSARRPELHDKIKGRKPVGGPGERYTNLHKDAGSLVALLKNIPGTTPQRLFGMYVVCLDATDKSPTAPGRPDASDIRTRFWEALVEYWGRDEQQRIEREAMRDQIKERWLEDHERIFGECLGWDDCKRRLILTSDRSIHVYDPVLRGYSEAIPLGEQDSIIGDMAEGPIGHILPFKEPGMKGVFKPVPLNEIKRNYSTRVAGVVAVAGNPVDVRMINGVLYLPTLGLREDLAPEYSPSVDKWLRLISGEEKYARFCSTLAGFLAFEQRPSASIAIIGKKGIGKGLLAQGFARVVRSKSICHWDAIKDNFESPLRDSPFIYVDEGFSKGEKTPSIFFRTTTGGGQFALRAKYRGEQRTICNYRWLITANNQECLSALSIQSSADRDALGDRLYLLRAQGFQDDDMDSPAAVFLKSGVSYDEGWVEDGKDVLAKHLLWIMHTWLDYAVANYSNSRMLVVGDVEEVGRQLALNNQAAICVAEQVCRLFSSPVHAIADGVRKPGWLIRNRAVFVDLGVLASMHASDTKAVKRYSAPEFRASLKTLCRGGAEKGSIELRYGTGKKGRFWQIDLDMIQYIAQEYDLDPNDSISNIANQISLSTIDPEAE